MLQLHARPVVLHRGQRLLHGSAFARLFGISHHGMDTLWQNVKAASSQGESAGKVPDAQPSVKFTVDLEELAKHVADAAKFRDEAVANWRKSANLSSDAASSEESGQSASASQADKATFDSWQRILNALTNPHGPAPSRFTLYKTLLQECQTPSQGTMAAFLKRLLNKSQMQALQKQTEELEEKDKALQAQAELLKAMTADRDKWMMQSEDLLAAARTNGRMTEAQLRAAAAVAAKRADDEATYANQQVAAMQQQLSQRSVKAQCGNPITPAKQPSEAVGADYKTSGHDKCDSTASNDLHSRSRVSNTNLQDLSPADFDWQNGSEGGKELLSAGTELSCMLHRLKTDSEQLLNHVTLHTLPLADQHSQVGHLIGRELNIAENLGASIKDLSVQTLSKHNKFYLDAIMKVHELQGAKTRLEQELAEQKGVQEEIERSKVQISQLEQQLTQQTGLQEKLQQTQAQCQQLELEVLDVSEVCRHQLKQIERLREALDAAQELSGPILTEVSERHQLRFFCDQLQELQALSREAMARLKFAAPGETEPLNTAEPESQAAASEKGGASDGNLEVLNEADGEVMEAATSHIAQNDGELSNDARFETAQSRESEIKRLIEKFDLWCQDWAESNIELNTAKDQQTLVELLQRTISKLAEQSQHLETGSMKTLAEQAIDAHQILHHVLAKEAHRKVWQAQSSQEVAQEEARVTSAELSRQMSDFYANSGEAKNHLVWNSKAGSSSHLV